MHREYHPADMHHLRVHAFEEGADHGHAEDHRQLYAFTALLGLLIGGDVLFGTLGWESWRAPRGISLAMVAALLGAVRIVYGALEALAHRRIGADIALAQACLAALIIGQPFVAAEVVFIAMVGEVLEAITFDRTQRAIHRLLDQTPRTARVRRDGEEREIPASQVAAGDVVIVRAGERIPVDGPVIAGRSSVDQSALTGEPIPADKGPSDPVYTGTINQFGVIEVRAEKVGHETTLGQVLRMVAEAQRRKSPLERSADRLARYFLPVVETVAGLTLLAGYLLGWPDVWLRTVAVLVVACPCALILATPAAVLASMAWLARHGVLIKGGAALERLAACDTFAFDKTGTLTAGRPEVASVVTLGGLPEAELLRLAAAAESASRHPLAEAVVREAARRGIDAGRAEEVETMPGAGVSARCPAVRDDGASRLVLVGNRRLFQERNIALGDEVREQLDALDARGQTPLLVAVDGRVAGLLGAFDEVRPEAHDVIHELKHLNVTEIVILTGDRADAARVVAKKTHIKHVEAERLPADKAAWIEARQQDGRRVAMVGDGINDAPALARAHVGIALGGMGTDLAAEAGDLVVLGEPLRVLPDLVRLSRATVAVIRQNIFLFAFGLNGVAMASAALGILGPVPAAVLHQAGSLLVLLNAMRLLAFGDAASLPPVRALRELAHEIDHLDDRLDVGSVLGRVALRWRTLAVAAVIGAVLVYASGGCAAIGPGERGLLVRGGRLARVLEPGLHLRWPPPLERVVRISPDRVRSVAIGFRSEGEPPVEPVRWQSGHASDPGQADDEGLLMTGDGHLIEMAATVQYRIDPSDPEALRSFVFGVADPERALRSLCETVVRAVVGRRTLETLLTSERRDAEDAAARLLRERTEAYRMGVEVTGVAFQDVHPPRAVVDAYRDVSRAESDRQRRANEGKAYRAEQVERAKGRAAETLARAEADRRGRLDRAAAEADTFQELLSARRAHPALTDHRIYWEAVGSALAGRPKVVLDPEHARRHLVVPGGPAAVPAPLLDPPRSADTAERRR